MKKSILFINGHMNVGGCEKSLLDVLKNIDYSKYKVDLLLLEELGDYFDEIPHDVNVQLYSINNAFGKIRSCIKLAIKNKDFFSIAFRVIYTLSERITPFFFRLLRPLFKNLLDSYDVIIGYRPGICTELAAYTFLGRKKISWWHHGEMNYLGDEAKKLHEAYYKMSNVVAVSKSSAMLIANTFPDINEKICIIPNMICVEELEAKSVQKVNIDKELDGVLSLVTVGRMSPEKNMSICPKIGKVLKEVGICFKWYLIGDGMEEAKIVSLIKEYNLQNEMIMLGRLKNPYPIIKKADILVHPSLVESQGITILESMALGTPVIVVKSVGPKEFIVHGRNGVLVESDAKTISDLIQKLWLNERYRQNMIINGRITVEKYAPHNVMGKIEDVIRMY